MSQARLAGEVRDHERYAGHRVWEGARGTIGTTYPLWQRHRYTRTPWPCGPGRDRSAASRALVLRHQQLACPAAKQAPARAPHPW
jgi:hypothetical protein